MKSLLLKYAQPFKDLGDPPYWYDNKRSLNLYCDTSNQVRPFVECSDEVLSISTKTEAIRESDDSADWCLTLATKTFTQKESDD